MFEPLQVEASASPFLDYIIIDWQYCWFCWLLLSIHFRERCSLFMCGSHLQGLWVKEQATVVFVILRVSFYPITKACMCFFLLPHSSWPPAFTVPDTQSSTALQEACVPDRSSSAAFLPSLLDFLALNLCTCACKSQTKNVKSIVHI